MLQSSIIGKLYWYWLNSFVFSVLYTVYSAFKRAFVNHRLIIFLKRDSIVEYKYSSSLFSRIINLITEGIVFVFQLLFDKLRPVRGSSIAVKFYDRYIKNSKILNFEFMLGGFICLMYIAPHSYWSNTYAFYATVGLLGLFVVMCTLRYRDFMRISELSFPALLFLIACIFSLNFSFDRSDSFRVLIFYITSFLFVYIIAADITNMDRLMKLLGFIYIAVILTSLFGVFQRFIGVAVDELLTDTRINKGVPGRVFSTLDNPNNFAEFLVIFSPLAAVFAATRKSTVKKVLMSGAMVFPIAALLMTYSRSGWVSAMLAIMVFVYFSNKKIIPAVILLGIFALPFLPESVTTRFLTLFDSRDTSNAHRIYVWTGVIGLIAEYFPMGIGLGPSSFAVAYAEHALVFATDGVPHSHMVYLELLVEVGVLGFISFIWYFWRRIKTTACAICATSNKELRLILIACIAPMIGMVFHFAAEYVWYYPRILFGFFILMGISTAAVKIHHAEKEQN